MPISDSGACRSHWKEKIVGIRLDKGKKSLQAALKARYAREGDMLDAECEILHECQTFGKNVKRLTFPDQTF